MTKRNQFVFVFSLLLLFSFIGWTAAGQKKDSTNRQAWEYKRTVPVSEETLNQLGAEGWELVATQANSTLGSFFIFKRAK